MTEYSCDEVTQVYEQPLSERIRLFLRLELIFQQAIVHQKVKDQYETQMCLNAIFALLNLTNRYELRLEILKELERIRSILLQAKKIGCANYVQNGLNLDELDIRSKSLHKLDSKYIDRIRNIDFLNIIKQRNIHDTGSYLFEIPELQYWLLKPAEQRSKQIQSWLNDFLSFKEAIAFLLRLIRDSEEPAEIESENGIYLETIDNRQKNHQLLRVEIISPKSVYPRISGSKHRFAIRFMTQDRADEKPYQTSEKVRFKLQSCSI